MGARDRRARASGQLIPALDTTPLGDGWELDAGAAGWIPAAVPGTVAGALEAAGLRAEDLDSRDWTFRTRLPETTAASGETAALRIGGLATLAEVALDGRTVLRSESMFAAHEVPLSGGERELTICCRALAPKLAGRRRPRARWRTRLVEEGNLRFFRTMVMGRAPGFAPGPPVVGPWRPVELVRRRGVGLEDVRLRSRWVDGTGVITIGAAVRGLSEAGVERARLVCRREDEQWTAELGAAAADGLAGELRIDGAAQWWPHTHGTPALHDVTVELEVGGETVVHELGRVGFRHLQAGADLRREGLQLQINRVPVFARGAVWTPLSLTAPHATREAVRPLLEQVVAAGMNLLRIPGTATYESDAFLDLCDELGILLWQDFMFANLDYPDGDAEFMSTVENEVRRELGRLAHRPCLAALCGGSEVAQQVAMLGLDPVIADGPLYGELLPGLVAEAGIEAPYVPSAPWGGALPFRPRAGVANYYGVGAYLRPLTDARLAEVRFAAECLAFANVPDADALPGGEEPFGPAWKRGVPRDAGAGWDFDDVRDHYLATLYGADPAALRYSDPERYLELSRAVSGEVMASVFGEWRRAGSTCHGALVLWLRDLLPGAGWGLLDHRGQPKAALHHLRPALAPVAVWLTDEGLNGIDVHVANDTPHALAAELSIGLYREDGIAIERATRSLRVDPHGAWRDELEALIGRFVDPGWSYRFGPRATTLVAATLHRDGELLSEAFHRPGWRLPPLASAAELGLEAERSGGSLSLRSARHVSGVRIGPASAAAEQWLGLEPGRERRVRLSPAAPPALTVTALNLRGRLTVG